MGGIGKTTLARLVVSISMDFDIVRIIKSVVESATLCACNLSDLISLQAMLRDVLSTRKFGSKGSKIIVTTRSTKVSSIVSCSKAYKLENLSDDDCWKVIEQKRLLVQTNQNLGPISRQIAKKCKGLPLVAVTHGCVLHCKTNEEEWHSILESELWDMPQTENVFPVLMLSYVHLPAHLRRCFAYCSIFPQNHDFEVEELVLLWMAEGFIQPRNSILNFFNICNLRVLGLSSIGIAELPDSVDKLEYLRYLNLSRNPISHLPESMCRLAALQTLKLTNCPQLCDLPKDMKNLANFTASPF
ncbi:UNVERIFIED_CONTAM: putative disease resistance RPP13-like protein 1 [Sesamum angustifolium]|uniref:Disease resistance RPP13-like protein 1 n=1 Tax=Sesamum angustifolium TaxID=2727405 RepID=A0AAW2JEE4_9LAMI